jgi:diguanylate cyclase (GGDEF)-like protein/PAS domain S-box-containing protein
MLATVSLAQVDQQPSIQTATNQEIIRILMDPTQMKLNPPDLTQIQVTALEAAANGVIITDKSGNIIWANPFVTRLTGYALDELIGQNTNILRSGAHDKNFYNDLWQTIQSGQVWRGRLVNRRKDGSHYHEEMTITPILDTDGQPINYLAIKEDVTAIHAAAEALEASEERFRRLINQVHAHFYMSEVSPQGEFTNRYISDNFQTLTGYPSKKFMQDWSFWGTLIHPDDQERCQLTARRIYEGHSTEIEYRIIKSDGEQIWVSDNAQVTTEPDGRVMVYATIMDITERKETEERIRFLATHDPLTSLPNRILFQEVLEHSLIYAKRNNEKLAVFFLDVNKFKEVNDNYGHHIGDELLKSIARRLRNSLREYDTVARISGDEFTLIAEQISSLENAKYVAGKIEKLLCGQYKLQEHHLDVSISIGGALYPHHGQDFETLMQKADAAMYKSKNDPDLPFMICGDE